MAQINVAKPLVIFPRLVHYSYVSWVAPDCTIDKMDMRPRVFSRGLRGSAVRCLVQAVERASGLPKPGQVPTKYFWAFFRLLTVLHTIARANIPGRVELNGRAYLQAGADSLPQGIITNSRDRKRTSSQRIGLLEDELGLYENSSAGKSHSLHGYKAREFPCLACLLTGGNEDGRH